jgi:4-hydroxybenzoate polyprenyltransferase
MVRYLIYSLRIRRVEYRVAELPIFLIPMLLTVRDASAFRGAAFWEGLLIFLFLFAFGDLLNCLADRELDAIYKPYLTEAVYGIGIRGVVVQAVLSGAAAALLAAHLSWMLDRWLLLALVLTGLFVAYAYSVEPIRLKGRGLWQLAFYWLGLFTGPMLFSALVFSERLQPDVLAVAVAYGMVQTGVILVNTAEDYPEDRQMKVETAIVALGLGRGIRVAAVLAVLGAAALLASFVWVLILRGGSPRTALALLPLAGACAAVSVGIWKLSHQIGGRTEEEADKEVKRSARWVPVWITSVALAGLLAAASVFIST